MWRSTSSHRSIASIFPSRPATLMASSMLTRQKGQAVTMTSAPASARHLDPHDPHAHLLLGLVEEHEPAAAAAERAVAAVADHLDPPDPRDVVDDPARRVVEAVVPAEVAGVVVDVASCPFCHGVSLSVPAAERGQDDLADVLHRRQPRVVLAQGVVGVGVGRHDAPDLGRVDRLRVLLLQASGRASPRRSAAPRGRCPSRPCRARRSRPRPRRGCARSPGRSSACGRRRR